ncbi:MAG: hypothetical protein IIW15_00140, partial [Firmicutes bacterium]|nr:hypothetical protein [Bacillota bacterium]
MYCGMAFDINDRERFSEYKDQFSDFLEEMNEDMNLINNATVIEFEDNLYLFVDGHDSILNWEGASDEFITVFLYSTCSDLEERAEELAEEFMEGTLFSKAEKLLEDHEDDIMTAVHEQTNSGDIIYVETLLDTL